MDTVGKLIAAALLCSVICLLLKKQAPELTLCLCVLVCALCFLTSFPFFSPILAFFHRLQELTGLSRAAFQNSRHWTAGADGRNDLPGQRPAGACAGRRDLLRLYQLLSCAAAFGNGAFSAANDDRRLICGAA